MQLDISRIQAICFDIDGTLRDTDDQYVERLARILRPLRILLPAEDEKSVARYLVMRSEGPVNAFFALADRLGLDGPLHKIIEFFSPHKGNDVKRAYKLVPGIIPALEFFSTRYPLTIVTTRSSRGTMDFLELSGIRPFFAHVATALTTPRGKPRPEPIYWAAAQMAVAPENCLMVGDTVMDIMAGKAAGAQTLAVLSGFGEQDELLRSGADVILSSVAELPGLFQK